MLIRIKNAALARHRSLMVPYSSLKERLGKILVEAGYLEKIKVCQEKGQKWLEIDLKYQGRKAVLDNLRQISKPGNRRFLKAEKMAGFRRRGPGIVILSTSGGLMSLEEAQKRNLGGELLCEVW